MTAKTAGDVRFSSLMMLGSLLIAAGSVMAQASDSNAAEVHVSVVNRMTGEPVPHARVGYESPGRRTGFNTATEEGMTTFRLPEGDYLIGASAKPDSRVSWKPLTLRADGSYDLTVEVHPPSKITGRVVTTDGQPLPFTTVYLVEQFYEFGEPQYIFRAEATANDLGEYEFAEVHSGVSYLLMAARSLQDVNSAVSDVPRDPERRRLLFASSYYPGTSNPEGAQQIRLADGEIREGMNIVMGRTPDHCIEGVLTGGAGPAELDFEILRVHPSRSWSNEFSTAPRVVGPTKMLRTGPDGKLRLCGLEAGDWRMLTYFPTRRAFDALGMATFTIGDDDIEGFAVAPVPHVNLNVDVVWKRGTPESLTQDFQNLPQSWVTLRAIGRPSHATDMTRSQQSPQRGVFKGIPAEFGLQSLFANEYSVQATYPSKLYLADVTLGGQSIKGHTFNPASATDGTLQIVLGADGGKISVQAVAKNGQPVSSAYVAVFPKGVTSPEQLSLDLMTGPLQQTGFTTPLTAPGDYLVMISDQEFTTAYDRIQDIWRARSQAEEVSLAPGGAQQVTLEFEP